MCKYKREIPQPKSLPYPRATLISECGFNLMLTEGYSMDWRNHNTYGKPINPKGKCMKCKEEIEVVDSF